MAQIKGYIGEILIERELRKRIQWDIYYLKNRSVWLDFNIFLSTLGHVFLKVFELFGFKRNSEKQ
jgi:lipopolysaccharide/colanic/teichoic acid biosynthesis glycosyltransferase